MNLKGKIIKIISEYEVLIDIGKDDGIEEDMLFVIYEEGDEIFHPVTNESLGKLELKKGKIRITHIQELFSKAINENYYMSDSFLNIAKLIDVFPKTKYRSKLDVDPKELTPLKKKLDDNFIHIGDLVRFYGRIKRKESNNSG